MRALRADPGAGRRGARRLRAEGAARARRAGEAGAAEPAGAARSGARAGRRPGAVGDGWLAAFNDPQLDALVQEALAYNPDLQVAAARVEQAAAFVKVAGATLYPQVNAAGARRRQDERRLERPAGRRHLRQLGARPVGPRARRARGGARPVRLEPRSTPSTRASRSPRMVAKSWFLATEARLQKATRRGDGGRLRAPARLRAGPPARRPRRRVRRGARAREPRTPSATACTASTSPTSRRCARSRCWPAAIPAAALSVPGAARARCRRPCRSACPPSCSSAAPTSSPPSGASPRRSTASRKRRPRACRASRSPRR